MFVPNFSHSAMFDDKSNDVGVVDGIVCCLLVYGVNFKLMM